MAWRNIPFTASTRIYFLTIDRTQNPPRITLAGVGYNKPITYLRPDAPKVSKPAVAVAEKPIDLNELRTKLIAEKFPNKFGSRLKPLDDVFSLAQSLKLTPEELHQFQDEAERVADMGDMSNLERFLLRIRDSRRP